ncbi:MAG: hypothetical protein ACLP50_09680 [Solirubrobacteraceae bacterium]
MADQAPENPDPCSQATVRRASSESVVRDGLERLEHHHLTRFLKWAVAALAAAVVAFFFVVPATNHSAAVNAAGVVLTTCRTHEVPQQQCKRAVPRAWQLELEALSGDR